MLFHPFLSKDTKKLIDMSKFCLICSSSILTCPIASPRLATFLSWYLIVARPSSIFAWTLSPCWTTTGNLPHLVKKGPPNLGRCLSKDSEMKSALYFLAHFFKSLPFLSLGLIFSFRVSASMYSIPASLHLSIWAASAMKQIFNLGLGICGSFTDPLNLLSLFGS